MDNKVKVKKPIFKKWWFWVLIVVIVAVCATGGKNDESGSASAGNDNTAVSDVTTSDESVTYEVVDVQTMLDDLKGNAMKAEKNYQDKYVEITAKIKSFDSDGSYISVEPVGADEWNFDTVMCYIKKSEHKDILMEKSVGDTVVIKGKITSIGEVLGYSLNIDDVK